MQTITLGCISLWSKPAPNLAQKARSADFSPPLGKDEVRILDPPTTPPPKNLKTPPSLSRITQPTRESFDEKQKASYKTS